GLRRHPLHVPESVTCSVSTRRTTLPRAPVSHSRPMSADGVAEGPDLALPGAAWARGLDPEAVPAVAPDGDLFGRRALGEDHLRIFLPRFGHQYGEVEVGWRAPGQHDGVLMV